VLGTAGSAAATVVTGWLSPLLFALSIVLLVRSFYVIYVRRVSTRFTTIVAWVSLTFMIGFWTWFLVTGGWGRGPSSTIDSSADRDDIRPRVVAGLRQPDGAATRDPAQVGGGRRNDDGPHRGHGEAA
jgi:hypothetical protein